MAIVISPSLEIPDSELEWKFTASGGPGGQHANKAATRAELTWVIEASEVLSDYQRNLLLGNLGPHLRIVADNERSQSRNRAEAERRLAQTVREGLVVQRSRRATKPTRSSKRRRLDAKSRRGDTKKLRQRPRGDD